MPAYKAPVEDVLFLLEDVFAFERYNNLPGFGDATADVVEAIEEAACRGVVHTPSLLKAPISTAFPSRPGCASP